MSKRQFLCVLGVWVAIFLFLGFPEVWHNILAVITGLVIIFVAYRLPRESIKNTSGETNSVKANQTFVENNK